MHRLQVVMLRRLTGLSVAVFMLHLNVARADAACAAHEKAAAGASTQPHDMGAMHNASLTRASATVADDTSCEIPPQPDCCEAMTACGPVLGAAPDPVLGGVRMVHQAIVARPFALPVSRVTIPEPPPPRL